MYQIVPLDSTDRYHRPVTYRDNFGVPVDASDEAIPAPGPLPGAAVTFQWLSHDQYAKLMGAGSVISRPECCGCHRTVPASQSYSAVPFDAKGMPTMVKLVRGPSELERFSYVFCGPCRFAEEAEHAWRHALAEDVARGAQRRSKAPTKQLERHPRL